MEKQWAENARAGNIGIEEDLEKVTLAEWAQQARDGKMPAMLLNEIRTHQELRDYVFHNATVYIL
jgi:hypothetical protein